MIFGRVWGLLFIKLLFIANFAVFPVIEILEPATLYRASTVIKSSAD